MANTLGLTLQNRWPVAGVDMDLSLNRMKGRRGDLSGNVAARVEDRTMLLESWMRDYGTRVMHLAYFYLKDRHLAEDVAQEVFLKAYRSMDQFRGDSQVYTWLYRITVNLCRDRLRSGWHKHMVLPGDLPPVSGGGLPDEEALKQDSRRRVLRHVMALPEHYREVLVLYYYQQLSTIEVAEITSLPENTVKTRLHRARQQLKQALAGEEVAP